jgi:hypothetical protein
MSAVPAVDGRTRYSSQRQDAIDDQAWPEFDDEARRLLESVGHVTQPAPGEILWEPPRHCYCSPPRTAVIRRVLKPSQCIRPT